MVKKATKSKSAKTVKAKSKSTVKVKATKKKSLWARLNKKVVGVAAVIIVVAAAFVGMKVLTVRADDGILWSSGVPAVVSVTDLGTDSSTWRDPCQAKFHAAKGAVQLMSSDPTAVTDCYLGAHNGAKVYTFNRQNQIAYQPIGESVSYVTQVACMPGCIYLPNKDQLIRIESNNTQNTGRIAIYDNFTTRLHLVDSADPASRFYSFDNSAPTLISNYFGQTGYIGYAGYLTRSSDERWLVFDIAGAGLFRVDLSVTPFQVFKFTGEGVNYSNFPLPAAQFDVSPDGQHVVLMGDKVNPEMIDITSTCGKVMTEQSEAAMDQALTNECPVLSLLQPLGVPSNNTWMTNMSAAFQPIFDSTGSDITFYGVSSDSSANKLIVLRAANYGQSPSPTPSPSPSTGPTPSDKTQCLKDGWKDFGGKYKNQGDCVSYVESPAKTTK